jgi:UDP-glucose 4-epimerase/UDP-glucuronate decarboxylase
VRIVNNPHSVNQIINIGSDNEVQIRVVADIILRLLKIEKKIMKEFPAPLGSVNRRVPQLDLVREIIGQLNHVPLEEGLRQTIRWYENHVF